MQIDYSYHKGAWCRSCQADSLTPYTRGASSGYSLELWSQHWKTFTAHHRKGALHARIPFINKFVTHWCSCAERLFATESGWFVSLWSCTSRRLVPEKSWHHVWRHSLVSPYLCTVEIRFHLLTISSNLRVGECYTVSHAAMHRISAITFRYSISGMLRTSGGNEDWPRWFSLGRGVRDGNWDIR